ncbi:MAG: hypothetical protein GX147_06670 [Deltaproteobacteria bacterium]|jgi:uncharacterized protein (DUF4213/DUF364 family)|nr:hypothetical protein [Deltaproteobacteria bacterium]
MPFYQDLKDRFAKLIDEKAISDETISVLSARTLTVKEAIGEPERDDYPLMRGKEFMMEADFQGAKGQAFTDMPGNFRGSLRDVLSLDLADNFQRAIFIATLNAVMRHEKRVEGTIHCRDQEPGLCAKQLTAYIQERYENPKIALIGYQPAMAASLVQSFPLRIVDLDEDNIGHRRAGVIVDAPSATQEVIAWCDVILATGSTATNDTIVHFLNRKPVIFFGVTVAGVAALCGLDRYCPFGH